eukprot:366186-Chlamydomonas_euryale.AAC.3
MAAGNPDSRAPPGTMIRSYLARTVAWATGLAGAEHSFPIQRGPAVLSISRALRGRGALAI